MFLCIRHSLLRKHGKSWGLPIWQVNAVGTRKLRPPLRHVNTHNTYLTSKSSPHHQRYSQHKNMKIPCWFRQQQHSTQIHCSFSTAFVGIGPLIVEASSSHSDTPHSVRLFRSSHWPIAETSTWQHTTLTTDRHSPGWIRTHNPNKRSDADTHLRPYGHWDRHKFTYWLLRRLWNLTTHSNGRTDVFSRIGCWRKQLDLRIRRMKKTALQQAS